MKSSVLILLALSPLLQAGDTGSRVLYVGGTVPGVPNKSGARIEMLQDDALKLSLRGSSLMIPYKDVNTLEYGMRVSRRYVEAVLISPLFLVAKKKTHFLTIGYTDAGRKAAGHGPARWVRTKSGRCWCRLKRARAGASNIRMKRRAKRARDETQDCLDLVTACSCRAVPGRQRR